MNIQRDIWRLEGNTVELRRDELAALDPANRALKEHYWATQEKMAADQAAAQLAQAMANAMASAAEETRRNAEQVKSNFSSMIDSVLEESKRLRGQTMGGPASLFDAQSQFAIATAQARAKDENALRALPGLAQAIEKFAEETATSATELRLIRASTASSLYQTGALVGQQFGISVPSFDVGSNYVPQDMLAMVHKGERITPAAYNNPYTPSSGESYAEVVSELRGLRKDYADVSRKLDAALVQIAKNTGDAKDALEGAVNGDAPLQVEVVVEEEEA